MHEDAVHCFVNDIQVLLEPANTLPSGETSMAGLLVPLPNEPPVLAATLLQLTSLSVIRDLAH